MRVAVTTDLPADNRSQAGLGARRQRGECPPVEFTRPEVAKILIESMKSAG